MLYNKELLEMCKKEIIKLLNIIEDIQNEIDEDYACKKNDLRPQKFRAMLSLCQEKRNISINKVPEEELYCKLFETTNYAAYPSDLTTTINFCINKFLEENEKKLIHKIYWEKKTYAIISQEMDTNISSLKKTENGALKKLKNPESVKYIEFGLNYEDELKKIRNDLTNESRSETTLKLIKNLPREIILTHIQASYLQKVKSIVNDIQNDLNDVYMSENIFAPNSIKIDLNNTQTPEAENFKKIKISELDIPTRAINSLQNHNILTIGDLNKYTRTQIQDIWGMGTTMLNKLEKALDHFGFELQDTVIAKNNNKKIKINDLKISINLINILENQEIYTLDDLEYYSKKQLLNIKGFNETHLNELEIAIKKFGVNIKNTHNIQSKHNGNIRISDMGLPARLENALKNEKIYTLDDINGYTKKELKHIKGLGSTMLDILQKELKKYNIEI